MPKKVISQLGYCIDRMETKLWTYPVNQLGSLFGNRRLEVGLSAKVHFLFAGFENNTTCATNAQMTKQTSLNIKF